MAAGLTCSDYPFEELALIWLGHVWQISRTCEPAGVHSLSEKKARVLNGNPCSLGQLPSSGRRTQLCRGAECWSRVWTGVDVADVFRACVACKPRIQIDSKAEVAFLA